MQRFCNCEKMFLFLCGIYFSLFLMRLLDQSDSGYIQKEPGQTVWDYVKSYQKLPPLCSLLRCPVMYVYICHHPTTRANFLEAFAVLSVETSEPTGSVLGKIRSGCFQGFLTGVPNTPHQISTNHMVTVWLFLYAHRGFLLPFDLWKFTVLSTVQETQIQAFL